MFKRLKNISKGDIVTGSFVLFIMINIFNFLNYIFHFFMARLLGPSDYGVLAVLMSLIYIFSIPSESIQTIITKYTTKLNIHNEKSKINYLIKKSTAKAWKLSWVFFILFLPLGIFLSYFLKINYSLILLTSLLIFYSFLIPIKRGILQGRKMFTSLGLSMVIEATFKVIGAIILVILGFRTYGAIGGMIISSIITFGLIILNLRQNLGNKEEETSFKGIYGYSLPIFISIISIVLIYSLDILLAKRFFPPEIAGQYAVASTMGKIILFGTIAIGKAMFPLSSEKHENGEKGLQLLKKSFLIVLGLSSVVLFIYLLFPRLIIKILFGQEYLGISNILFLVGLSFTFISLANLIILYKLSIDKFKKASVGLLFFVGLQIGLMSLFHSNLVEFSLAFLSISFLMFLYTLIPNKNEKNKHNNSCIQ